MSRPTHAILCVDDDVLVLDSLRAQLRDHFAHRFAYEAAESAEEAWEVIDELVDEGVDILLIVSDWLMPGTRGDEFLIAVHERHPRIVKVMVTGQASPEAIERARRDASLHACIAKPWSRDELLSTIERALGEP